MTWMFSNKSEEECNNVNSCNFIEFENRFLVFIKIRQPSAAVNHRE